MNILLRFSRVVLLGLVLSSITLTAADKDSKHQRVSVEEFEKILKEKKLIVLDVRTPREYKGGHIKGAKLIDFYADDFVAKIGKLDKDKEYLVTCAGGVRSAKACKMMAKLGFKKLYDLAPGMRGWVSEGKPVTK
ncbi:MAG: hypothetical protein CMO80_16850 [Verrucomicrobiales bacterium]|nr:hypothetical protein [Verrucomicrobiales bacterium]